MTIGECLIFKAFGIFIQLSTPLLERLVSEQNSFVKPRLVKSQKRDVLLFYTFTSKPTVCVQVESSVSSNETGLHENVDHVLHRLDRDHARKHRKRNIRA